MKKIITGLVLFGFVQTVSASEVCKVVLRNEKDSTFKFSCTSAVPIKTDDIKNEIELIQKMENADYQLRTSETIIATFTSPYSSDNGKVVSELQNLWWTFVKK